MSEFVVVVYLTKEKKKKENQNWQTNLNNRHNFATQTFKGVTTCSFSENGSTLDFHHEKGQQMENNSRTGRRVVLEAHTGHQVNEESVALLSELSMLVERNPSQNKRAQIYNNPDCAQCRAYADEQ